MAGVDLTAVKELLGHKDITMIQYAHLAPCTQEEGRKRSDGLLNLSPTTTP